MVLNVFVILVILIDSVYGTSKKYYPHVFLEKCKFVVKINKMPGYITDEIEISSDDSDEENFNEEN